MRHCKAAYAAACFGVIGFIGISHGQVVINEVGYDDGGTDDREFVELYNSGASPVNIGGWTLSGRDPGGANGTGSTITTGTILNPGGFYVLGLSGTLNSNQTLSGTLLENDNETVELYNGATLVDALLYESGRGASFTGVPTAQTGPGFFGQINGNDLAGTPLNQTVSLGRFVDGRDTNNNGRDFGMRPSTPGSSNNSGLMTLYTPPNPTGGTVGNLVSGLTGSFNGGRIIDPTAISAYNPNTISVAPTTGNRAIVAWDSTGGGNGVTSNEVFATKQGGFNILAYLDTTDNPQSTNASNVAFLGSEVTLYGVGAGDAMSAAVQSHTDLAGNVGIAPQTLPLSESLNGFTGVAWVYERTSINGANAATQALYLVDANDGGDSDLGGNTPLDWTILQTIDISGLSSNWFELGIEIDALGNGVATFNGTDYNFIVSEGYHMGAFNVGYRENLQAGADTTPDAQMRPATFTLVPEPTSLALFGLGGLFLSRRHRRS
jgi:hypothetical protein